MAEQQGQLIGLAYSRGMPCPSRVQMIGFLDDLFVVPDHRCSGAAVALVKAVRVEARLKAGALWAGSPVIKIIGPAASMISRHKKPIGCSMK